MYRYLLSVLALSALLGNASAGDKLTKTLLAREMELVEAIKQQDQPKLKKLLASQVYSVAASGRRTTPQLLKVLAKTSLKSYKITGAKAIPASEKVGILSYKVMSSGTENNKPYSLTHYATSVWVLREGEWVSIFYQETPIDK